MRPVLALGLSVLIVVVAFTIGPSFVLLAAFALLAYLMWDEQRSRRAISASVAEGRERSQRAFEQP